MSETHDSDRLRELKAEQNHLVAQCVAKMELM